MLVVLKRFIKGKDLLIFLGLLYRVLSIVSGELFFVRKVFALVVVALWGGIRTIFEKGRKWEKGLDF